MATTGFYLDTRSPLSDGTFPLRVRVTHERKTKYFPTVFSFSVKEYEKIMSNFRLNEEQRVIKDSLDDELKRAEDIIKDLKFFSFATFQLRFTFKGDRKDLISLMEAHSQKLLANDNFSNGNLYHQAAELFKKYKPGEKIILDTVTPEWLRDFEKWALRQTYSEKKGKTYSYTTLNMYLTRARKIFNDAIKAKELSPDQYPFGKDAYVIPKPQNNKRPLEIDDTMTIFNYAPTDANEQFSKDMYIFSYLGNGMNMYDIFKLKWGNIHGDHFSFIRKKNENRPTARMEIDVILDDELQTIIDRHGVPGSPSDYIFPVLRPGLSPKEEQRIVRATITKINTNLKKIAKRLGVTDKISTYFARHSYANLIMEVAPLAQISRDLGHKTIQTTQNYLDQLPTKKRIEVRQVLLKRGPDEDNK
ncbi:MAG TPA: site-specific integrase [Sphingobacteriaceae bacterium]